MPALQFAGRLWPVADDDLVGFGVSWCAMRVPYVSVLAHALLGLRAHVLLGASELGPSLTCVGEIELVALVALAIALGAMLVDALLSISSASGSVWQAEPRRAVGPLMVAHVCVLGVEALWLAAGLLLPAQLLSGCTGAHELGGVSRPLHLATAAWLVLVLVCTPPWVCVLLALSRSVAHSARVSQQQWCRGLFALLCGCCVPRARDDTLDSISRTLAGLLSAHGAERAVGSDLLAGLLLVRDAQTRESREDAQQRARAAGGEASQGPPSSSRLYSFKQARRLQLRAADEADAVRDAAHFIRFALGAYGMPIALWVGDARTVREGCCPPGRLGACSRCRCRRAAEASEGEPARRHEVAFVRTARIAPSDMLASDWARRSRPSGSCAYAVCVDRASRSVVIAVRGTLDASDLLVDVCAETVDASQMRMGVAGGGEGEGESEGEGEGCLARFAASGEREGRLEPTAQAAGLVGRGGDAAEADDEASPEPAWVSHRGIVEAAHELHAELGRRRVLAELRRQLFHRGGLLRGYALVVTGHSLGAGVASLLTLLLRADGFGAARCVAFSPPPILPRRAAALCAGAVLSVALEGDVVPRLSLASVHALAAQLVAELRRCEAPKWLIGLRATRRALSRALCGESGAPAPPLGAPPSLRACGCAPPDARAHLLIEAQARGSACSGGRSEGGVRLYLAGRVMLLEGVGEARAQRYSVLPCLERSAAEHEAKWVDAEEFQELKLAHSMIDHLPDRMAHILEALARAARAGAPDGAPDGSDDVDDDDDVELALGRSGPRAEA